jgi:hypothetical protein
MAPQIVSVSNKLFYGGLLESATFAYQIVLNDLLFGTNLNRPRKSAFVKYWGENQGRAQLLLTRRAFT